MKDEPTHYSEIADKLYFILRSEEIIILCSMPDGLATGKEIRNNTITFFKESGITGITAFNNNILSRNWSNIITNLIKMQFIIRKGKKRGVQYQRTEWGDFFLNNFFWKWYAHAIVSKNLKKGFELSKIKGKIGAEKK